MGTFPVSASAVAFGRMQHGVLGHKLIDTDRRLLEAKPTTPEAASNATTDQANQNAMGMRMVANRQQLRSAATK